MLPISRPFIELLAPLYLIVVVPSLVQLGVCSASCNCHCGDVSAGLPVVKITSSSATLNCSSQSESLKVNCNSSVVTPSNKTPLYLVVMAPYPDCPPFNPSWARGPAVVPAAIVAKDLINSRDDILKGYRIELIMRDSGCNISSKAVTSLLQGLFYSDKNVVGIIGPGCSEAALAVAPLISDNKMSLIQVAPTATSPNLTDTSLYPNTFRPIISAWGFVDFQLNLMELKKYHHVGAVYEVGRAFQSTVYAHFEKAVKKKGVLLTSFGLFEGHFPLDEFRYRIRVIFVFASTDYARQLLCAAANKSFLYPDYQFIFINRRPSNFMTNVSVDLDGTRISCDETIMMEATRGMVFTNFRLARQDRDYTKTDAGISYNEFSERYERARKCHLQLLELEESTDTVSPHYSNYFDATWALALSLNNSLPHLEEMGLSLSNYSHRMPEITKIVKKEILILDFEGMRGRVQFSSKTHDGADVTIIDVYQVDESDNYGLIGYMDPSNGLSNIEIFDNASLIPAQFNRKPHIAFGIIITVVVTILFVALLVCQAANVVWGSHKNIKATSPNLNHLIFSGCYLSLVGAIVYTNIFVFIDVTVLVQKQSNVLVPVHCSALQWSCTMMYSLVFGTLCAKRWRIHRIFNSFHAAPVKYVSDNVLIPIALLPVVIDIVLNIAWNSIDPWQFHIEQSDHLSACQTKNEIVWSICIAVPKVVLTVVVLYLAIATRRVHKKEFKQTKSINILIYNLVILTGIFLPIFFILQTASDDTTSKWPATVSYLIFCMFDIGFVVLCIILVLLPPLIPSIKAKLLKRTKTTAQCSTKPVSLPANKFNLNSFSRMS